jgi:hypothetical protein
MWSPDFTAIAGFERGPVHTPLLAVAIGLLIVGVFAFVSVLTRLV